MEKRGARIIAITGRPGVGKTTTAVKAARTLARLGFNVDGFYSREIRERGTRKGFEIVDFKTGETVVLASVSSEGPRIGRYKVNIRGLEDFIPRIVERAVATADIVLCDEIGPMELLSPAFKRSMSKLLSAPDICILAVMHRSMRDPVMKAFVRHPEAVLVEITEENRDCAADIVVETVMKSARRG